MKTPESTTVETRERIIKTAQTLFHQKGICSVGVAEICQTAEIVKGSLYHFFPSKSELSKAVLERNWEILKGHIDFLKGKKVNGREKLELFFEGIIEGAIQMQDEFGRILGCNIGSVVVELAGLENSAKTYSARVLNLWLQEFVGFIKEGQADKSIEPSLDPRATAEALLALVQGMSVLGRAFNDIKALKRVARQGMSLVPKPFL